MASNKTGGSLKGVFDPAKKAAAAAIMEPQAAPSPAKANATGARNRKAGGRNVRVSGYIPSEIDEFLRDEVIKRTVAQRRTVSFNDVLCDALAFWKQSRSAPE
jgi:hypothetical protein